MSTGGQKERMMFAGNQKERTMFPGNQKGRTMNAGNQRERTMFAGNQKEKTMSTENQKEKMYHFQGKSNQNQLIKATKNMSYQGKRREKESRGVGGMKMIRSKSRAGPMEAIGEAIGRNSHRSGSSRNSHRSGSSKNASTTMTGEGNTGRKLEMRICSKQTMKTKAKKMHLLHQKRSLILVCQEHSLKTPTHSVGS